MPTNRYCHQVAPAGRTSDLQAITNILWISHTRIQISRHQSNWDGKQRKTQDTREKPQEGVGNLSKNITANRAEKTTVEHCGSCGKNLSNQESLESTNEQIVEDIPDVVEKLEVIQIEQEKKCCDECKEVITAKSELTTLHKVGGNLKL